MSQKIADSADLVRASPWARQVYTALKDWDAARRGRWSTWEDGALFLTIEKMPGGAACEPVNILAANNLIAFTTRRWETQLPRSGQSFDAAVADIKTLARKWFDGEIALAAFFLGDDWKGSTPIDPKNLQQEIGEAFQWISAQTRVDRVEIQTARIEKDQFFGLAVDGKTLT